MIAILLSVALAASTQKAPKEWVVCTGHGKSELDKNEIAFDKQRVSLKSFNPEKFELTVNFVDVVWYRIFGYKGELFGAFGVEDMGLDAQSEVKIGQAKDLNKFNASYAYPFSSEIEGADRDFDRVLVRCNLE